MAMRASFLGYGYAMTKLPPFYSHCVAHTK
jgi:hypothetical protein